MRQARLLQRLQVIDAVGTFQGEGFVRAPQVFGYRVIIDAKVAHVDLVDADILRRGQVGLGQGRPSRLA